MYSLSDRATGTGACESICHSSDGCLAGGHIDSGRKPDAARSMRLLQAFRRWSRIRGARDSHSEWWHFVSCEPFASAILATLKRVGQRGRTWAKTSPSPSPKLLIASLSDSRSSLMRALGALPNGRRWKATIDARLPLFFSNQVIRA
jgi:hypothetical protein